MRRLDILGIPYDVTPGVPAYLAAAAKLKKELTLPNITQTIIATRTSMHSTKIPREEDLEILSKSKSTLAIHLSIRKIKYIVEKISPFYGTDCPVVIAYRVGWPEEKFIHGRLKDILNKVKESKITRSALILVGKVFDNNTFKDSSLYSKDSAHIFRAKEKKSLKT